MIKPTNTTNKTRSGPRARAHLPSFPRLQLVLEEGREQELIYPTSIVLEIKTKIEKAAREEKNVYSQSEVEDYKAEKTRFVKVEEDENEEKNFCEGR
ncbi:hypothetical protein M7I_7752 [Glarea lozoyensis 74030]|uniref:Uncharacterized protein n=1 Tax=Glarea lozoyensis (strain ATCC 74030 / MF5533) TaxID=1104152 RepID=H0EY55_GLAL7|nr:hypothetical protein M7I_7752 [Glarea lozoyensis 74030]